MQVNTGHKLTSLISSVAEFGKIAQLALCTRIQIYLMLNIISIYTKATHIAS